MIAAREAQDGDYSTPGLKESQRVFAQAGLAPAGVGHQAPELAPEVPAVAADPGVDEFVEDDVIGQIGRDGGQEDVELDPAGAGGAAPERGLPPDAQPAGPEAVLAGQDLQAPGQEGPGRPPVEPFGRGDGVAAALAGPFDPGQAAPDPGQPGQGQAAGLLERDPQGDGDADAARGADGDGDAPGPPAFGEDDGPDAVELIDPERRRRAARAFNPRNRTASGSAWR